MPCLSQSLARISLDLLQNDSYLPIKKNYLRGSLHMMALRSLCSIIAVSSMSLLNARSVLLEFKGSYFLPTDCRFKTIYHKGTGLFGPELTVQLTDTTPWHAFVSVDYFKKWGKSIGFCNATEVKLIPIAFGLKYFFPACCEYADFYLGLGFEAVNVHTKDCSPFVTQSLSKWACGGIAKGGVYWYLPNNLIIDIFIDYSFAKTGSGESWCQMARGIQSLSADVSGPLFGAGFGYRF